jgi:hypothetical protein
MLAVLTWHGIHLFPDHTSVYHCECSFFCSGYKLQGLVCYCELEFLMYSINVPTHFSYLHILNLKFYNPVLYAHTCQTMFPTLLIS